MRAWRHGSTWPAGLGPLVAALASCWLGVGWHGAALGAQDFAVAASPPRFELKGQAGQILREVLEINQATSGEGAYRVYTADWTLGADGDFQTSEALAPGSCRPWVALERPRVSLRPGGRMKYRFEVQIPEPVADGECRFALMVEGAGPGVDAGPVQVGGRIAVVVYVRVGRAAPAAQLQAGPMVKGEGGRLPSLLLTNTGNVTLRPNGVLRARGREGGVQDLEVQPVPVLPGMTRRITLAPAGLPTHDASLPQSRPISPRLPKPPVRVQGELAFEPPDLPPLAVDHEFVD